MDVGSIMPIKINYYMMKLDRKPCKVLILVLLVINLSVSGQIGRDGILRLKSVFKISSAPKDISDLFSEIKYIPLESTPDCLLGYMSIKAFGKDILIKSHDERMGLFRYSPKGKFLNKIGNRGRGPTEYLDNIDVELIDDTVFVVSGSSKDIICYSLSGKFLSRYHINITNQPVSIFKLPDNSFMISLRTAGENGRLIRTDKSFNIKTGFMNNRPQLDAGQVFSFQKSKDKVYYYHPFIDTLFDVSQGFPIPSIIVDNGKLNKPAGLFSNPKTRIAEMMNYTYIVDFMLSDDFIILMLWYNTKEMLDHIFYRFSDGKIVHLNRSVNNINNIEVNTTGGFLANDNYLIYYLTPSSILKRYQNMTSEEKKDVKNLEFLQMASKITPESNPVLMVCKLK
jgi:hypothetical protein